MEVLDLTGRKGLVVGIANEQSLAWAYTTAVTGEVLYVDAGFHIEGAVLP